MFTAARAALALVELDSSKHSGIISLFNREFVKTGRVERTLGRILLDARDLREDADYEEFFAPDERQVVKTLGEAERFVTLIEDLILRWTISDDGDDRMR